MLDKYAAEEICITCHLDVTNTTINISYINADISWLTNFMLMYFHMILSIIYIF
jgi:hypothetical protein